MAGNFVGFPAAAAGGGDDIFRRKKEGIAGKNREIAGKTGDAGKARDRRLWSENGAQSPERSRENGNGFLKRNSRMRAGDWFCFLTRIATSPIPATPLAATAGITGDSRRAFSRSPVIPAVAANGVAGIGEELIPFLSGNNDDDDEVLLAMAEELGVFIPYIGGIEHAHVLLPPLETLCTVEETCVRDKAVESLCRIGSQMKETRLVDSFVPLVKTLTAGEWFTARVSACGLFHTAYPSASETLKTELRSVFSQLCQDDMPMVRRAAATNLGKFAATVESSHLKTDVMQIIEDLTQDDQDSVRLLSVEACASLGKLLQPEDCVAHILPVIVNFSQDATIEQLLPIFLSLLKDEFPDVRLKLFIENLWYML
ncbi:hypothetical protein L1887_14705 [Cichorium endivia]|nr:hypothetical protein L1887_14705 [Cichorium endivia]